MSTWWYIGVCKGRWKELEILALLYLTIGCRYTVTTFIDILLKYDIVILYDIVINTKTLILLVDYITSNKQVIIINSGVNKVILNNESNLSKYGLKIYEYTVEKMNEINKLYLRIEKIKKLRNKTLPKN